MANSMAKGIGGLVAATIGVMMLIMTFIIVPMVGFQLDESISIQDDVDATGVVTFTGVGVADEIINISSETYTMKAAADGEFQVTIGANATVSMTNLVAEITANSTQVSATSVLGVGTVTSLVTGTAGNAYELTTDITDASVDAATLTGGVDASNWHEDSGVPTGYDLWTNLSGIIAVAALVMIVGGIFVSFKSLKED